MRKQVAVHSGAQEATHPAAGGWMDLDALAQIEVSSEAEGHPIENALVPGSKGWWQAAAPGTATLTLCFDAPQAISRVLLVVRDGEQERSQEWALFAKFIDGTRRELLRQGWNFSPGGSTEQREEYAFDLKQVTALTLTIDPDRGRDRYPATLSIWRVGANG